MHIPDIARN